MIDATSGIAWALNASDEPALSHDSDRRSTQLLSRLISTIACYGSIVQRLYHSKAIHRDRGSASLRTGTKLLCLDISTSNFDRRSNVFLPSFITYSKKSNTLGRYNGSTLDLNSSTIVRTDATCQLKSTGFGIRNFVIVCCINAKTLSFGIKDFQIGICDSVYSLNGNVIALHSMVLQVNDYLLAINAEIVKRRIGKNIYVAFLALCYRIDRLLQRGILRGSNLRHILRHTQRRATYCHQQHGEKFV